MYQTFYRFKKQKASKLALRMLLFVVSVVSPLMLQAQVNTGGSATTANHNKQVIGYITNWDAWKSNAAGVPSAGALTHMNIDYSKYTILNYSFFGVAKDGSLHSGDLRNKNIYQEGAVQEPGDLFYTDVYSSWDLHILFGEIEAIQWINEDVKTRAAAQGFQVEVGATTWTNTNWGLSGSLPLPLHKEGGAPGLLEMAHNNGVKVVASIGGWSMCKHFPEMAADASKRAKFIADCKKLIATGFDGIDLDWEYPGPYSGMNFTGSEADFANYATLVTELRNAIGPDKLITAAMAADPAKLQGFNWGVMTNVMNYFNMMTYDFNGGWSNIAGHNAPVYPYDGAEEPTFNWQSTYNALMSMGVPSNMINFGIPFYGRGVITQGNAALNAATQKTSVTVQPDGPISTCADYTNWPLDVYDGTPNYFYIKQKTGSGWTKHWDDQAKVPYMTKGKYFLSYDDEESIAIKADYINDQNLGGTIIWTVFGDLEFSGSATSFGTKLKRWSSVSSPLINVINQEFAAGGDGGTTNTAPFVSISSPANGASFNAGSTINITANASDNDGTVTKVEFYNGSEKLGEDATSPYSLSWSGVGAGNYTISVKAYDNDGASASSSVSVSVSGNDNGGGDGDGDNNGGGDCPNANFRVVGYMPSWAGSADAIQYDKLTHIIYSFLLPNADGSFQAIENASKLQQIVTLAHAQGVKVEIAIGGWNDGNDSGFATLAANASTRNAFVSNVMNFVSQYNLDGVDIDWEYPREGSEPQNYEALMEALGASLHAQGKELSAAVVASGWTADGVLDGVFNDIDFLNLMAYDGGDGAAHSPFSYAVSSLDYWLGRGLPASKVVLGVPFYGRPTWQTYSALISQGADPNADVFNGVYYNGINTIQDKTNLALERASGIMIWEISQDTQGATSLLSAIHDVVGDCDGGGNQDPNAPSVNITSPSNGSSFMVGSSVSLVASASDSDGSITSVVFNVNGQNITATGSGSTYTASWSASATGSYTVKATATDNSGLTSTSQVTISVNDGTECNVPAWGSTNVYVGGDHVSYNGIEYQAKWWTQGENPATNTSGAWLEIGPCGSNDGGGDNGGGGSCNAPAWSSSTAYVGGDHVSYNGTEYRAKWWTQGENPAENPTDAWEVVGACSARIAYTSTTEEGSLGVKVYPNPFKDNGVIEFTLSTEAFTSISLYNQLGKEVKSVLSKTLSSGNHRIEFSTESLPEGIYFYKLSTGKEVQTIKVIKH